MSYTIRSLGYGQVAVLQNGKHVKKFGGASAATDARMFINKQHQASLPKERAPGLKEHELVKELEGINNNIGSFTEDMLEQFEVSEINDMIENYQSFEKTVAILEEKGAKSSKAMAAFIGRKKYSGKKCDEAVEDLEENHKFINVATSKKIIADAEKALKDNPDMWPGPKAGFKTLITVHKKHLEKAQKNESVEYIEEKLTEKDPSSKWIEDFVKSDNPKFAGKSKKERIKMALGAFYGKQNEEAEFDALAEEIAGLFEDADQLDELKKSTLASYIKKSAGDMFIKGANAADAFSNKEIKKSFGIGNKADKRAKGIDKALDRLTRESFADQFFDGEIIREEIQLPNLQEADKNYDAYFKACMKNAGITSISDLKTAEEKKEFMNKVDAGFKAKNEDMFYENFMRSDIEAKVAGHEKSGNKVADVTHKIYQGKPYAEFTVTTPDGTKKKYIFHGNVTRHEKLA